MYYRRNLYFVIIQNNIKHLQTKTLNFLIIQNNIKLHLKNCLEGIMWTHRKAAILIIIIIGCASVLGSADTCIVGCNNMQMQDTIACGTAKAACDTTCLLFSHPEQCYDKCSEAHASCIEDSDRIHEVCFDQCQ
jgi:hypothetical protein